VWAAEGERIASSEFEKEISVFQLIQFQMQCINREWLEKTVKGKICKREIHEFRKVLCVMADEDMKDRNDFLKNGYIMNALLLNVVESI
jgi:hypothetical protein